ncbi:hypothetical protein J437_LFUL008495 [Ladona fulva]|uniref:Uncharacterized protein n=1 Tax=Ladona fulva TaxID=123851 RepID=A0A8K0K9G0_LADFU|nr:hypothetical protein J437_LFUL008495 [Ladona fulva]
MAHTSDESSSPEVSRSLLSAPVHSTLSRPRLHSHPNHHQRNSSPSSRQSALCPNNSPSSLGTQSVLRDSGKILPPAGEKVNYSEEGAPIGNLRRGNSAENLARQTVVQGQRLLVSEHLSFDGHKIAPNGTLKRLKTECEQPQLSSEDGAIRLPPTPNAMRRGSLDSLQEAYGQEGRDRPSSDVSDDVSVIPPLHPMLYPFFSSLACHWVMETRQAQGQGFWCFLSHLHPQANFPLSHAGGSDLLASLTSTFDKKLRSLLGPGASHSSGEQHSAQGSPRELHPEEAESTTPEQSKTSAPNSLPEESNQRLSERIGATTQKDPDKWSAKKEKEVTVEGMEEKVARGGNDRRSKNSVTVETTPPAETVESKPRRTDSLSKTEKTEANTKTKDGERQWRRREAGTKRGGGDDEAKLKRKNGMPDRSIKRRHTVGGTKDFDKIEWAVTNGREGDRSNNAALPDEKERGTADGEGEVGLRAWVGRERLRTSSPDLGCRRALGSSFVVEINVLLPGAVVGRCGVVRGDGGPGGGVGARPHGLPTTRVHEQPLESHV